jgi:hypothetical protein
MSKSRDVVISTILPRLIDCFPDGIVSRSDFAAECTKAGIPFQYWMTKTSGGRGLYDMSEHYKLVNESLSTSDTLPAVIVEDTRTDAEIEAEINARFQAVIRMGEGVISSQFRAMLVSGNPGIGKTYTLEDLFTRAADDGVITFQKVNGYVKPTGLFRLFWENKEPNCVLMFDDADSIFTDDVGLNLLKAACDSTKSRWISWRSEKDFDDKSGESDTGNIPKEFEFKGHIVFVTNLDFDKLVRANNKLTPHLNALMSRSFYLDLNLPSVKELMVRIKYVVTNTDMLCDYSETAKTEIIAYMEANISRLREISLRMVLKLAQIYRTSKSSEDFKLMALASCIRR